MLDVFELLIFPLCLHSVVKSTALNSQITSFLGREDEQTIL